jgi:hypothetical protein
VAVILERVPRKQLMAVYKIPAFEDVDGFLRLIAGARGKLKRGGVPDMQVRGCVGCGLFSCAVCLVRNQFLPAVYCVQLS